MNYLIKIVFTLFFGSILLVCSAQNTIITGNNPSYANQVITLLGYQDYITNTTEILATDTADTGGNFKLIVSIPEVRKVIIPAGIYNLSLYLEPGKEYAIHYPDYKEKGYAELLNPYFLPTEVEVGIEGMDTSDINMLIRDFDMFYSELVEQNQNDMLKRGNKVDSDSIIQQLESVFSTFTKPYFEAYRTYRYAWLKFVTTTRDNRYIIRDYFHEKPFLLQNTAYMDLFNQLFSNYLSFYMNTKDGERLFSDLVYAKSPTYIYETFENNLVLTNHNLQEFVLLKGLHDGFYSGDFPTSSLVITLDSISQTTENIHHKNLAKNIKLQALQVRSGYPIPSFSLPDSDSLIRNNQQYLENYVYLNFCTVKSFACQKDFQLLKGIHEKHKEKIKIISISVDENFEEIKTHFKKNDYNWILLDGNSQKDLAEKYKVKAYPTYFLIDKKGNFAMTPTPGPTENFEYKFFQYLQNNR